MTLLIVAKPQSHILIIVCEIIGSSPVLLVLKPLTFIFFSIGKRIDAIPLSFAFYKLALVGVAIAVKHVALSLRLATRHFAFVLSSDARFALAFGYRTRAQSQFLGKNIEWK